MFGFHLVDLSIGWNLPSSAFCKPGFIDRKVFFNDFVEYVFCAFELLFFSSSIPIIRVLGLFMVSQISLTFCFVTFWDLVFSLTDESISSIFFGFFRQFLY
ncbi:hypothetical protein STEG23_031688 [Scotinomys teguina]